MPQKKLAQPPRRPFAIGGRIVWLLGRFRLLRFVMFAANALITFYVCSGVVLLVATIP